jgi:nicotinate phosphoribosyltransferase
MNIEEPILTSMLDDDLYKINMGSVVFHLFPRAIVTYEFINRGKTRFPTGFAAALRRQIQLMSDLRLTFSEAAWMTKNIPYIRPTYIEWLSGFKLNPDEVSVSEFDGDLTIRICGPWYRAIFWEVKLMAVISELYFKMTGQFESSDWKSRIERKGIKLQTAGCHWIDFGTRRRYSLGVQDELVRHMKFMNGFLGTSNPFLAYKHNVVPHGTYAHECIMAMSALYGVRMANKMWMKHWAEHFDGNVGVALTDTFTTSKFLQDFGSYEARLFDGCRQDSADPLEWGVRVLAHYNELGILTSNKRLVFSDNLNDDKYIKLDTYFRQWAQPVGGIGTFFTNDVGVKPLNMVIKMTAADFGHGAVNVVKLSDEPGKYTGKPEAIELVKRELNII